MKTNPTLHTTSFNKAIFFDRDGTINSDEGHYYIYKPTDFVFNKGVIKGMKSLQEAGYLLFIITNQGGVAKGVYTDQDVSRVHNYMCDELKKEGIKITKIYYCPHHESVEKCDCRKPSPYMVNCAIKEFHIDKQHSWFIGDSTRDTECAQAAGIQSIHIQKNQDLTPIIEQILKANSKNV